MENQPNDIGPLKKVSLELTVTPSALPDSGNTPIPYDFIYGVGNEGITPFEKALFGKSINEAVDLHVGTDQANLLFGHLACDILQCARTAPPFDMYAVITSIETPDNREVVKAMAKSSGCGDGCDCGCGC